MISLKTVLILLILCVGLYDWNNQLSIKKTNETDASEISAIDKRYVQHGEGTIVIPALNIRQNIYSQSNSEALNKGAEQLRNSAYQLKFGEGNLVLAAHNYNDNHRGFSRLQQNTNQDAPYLVNDQRNSNNWLNGTEILIVNSDRIYVYSIDGQNTVRASDTSVLEQTTNRELNLITCLFPSDQYRIVTHANQTGSFTWEQAPQLLKNQVLGR